ncbi:MAG: Do family serine endopeptidase [Bacteroidaceae bacterium]|nr:Do family serine endopeptidase [Bacteroidaceae bacterium]
MKQTMKRIYGTLALVAFVSGVTGAVTFSFLHNRFANADNDPVVNSKLADSKDDGFMTLASKDDTPKTHAYIDLTEAAEKGCAAVVYIKVTQNGTTRIQEYYDPFDDMFSQFFGRGNGGTQRRQIQTPKRQGAGSGVIISSDGYIVTNNHVVEGADDIEITLNDNREFKATVVGMDANTDLALLKIDGKDLPTLVIGDSDELKVGEWVLAVGNPFNLKSTVTAGIVSAKARKIAEVSRTGNEIESYIQTDAAINAGNSGGALVNSRGELVGINAALYSQTGSFTGYGFAIPTTIMKKVVSDLKEYGAVQRALIGISGSDLSAYVDDQKAKDEKWNQDFGTNEGVYVADVMENGAAKEAGIKEGDVIVSVNDKKISKMSELQEVITRFSPGDKVTVGILRDKKAKTVDVVLKNGQGNTQVVKAQNLSSLGAEFKELTADQKKSLNLSNGVQVTKLESNSPLRKMGVGNDFIIMLANNVKINTVADLERVFKSACESEAKTLFVWGKYPSGRTGSYAIELEQ